MSEERQAQAIASPQERMAPPALPRRRRALAIAALALLAVSVAAWYVNSGYFYERMRHKLVTELENITGGTVEIGRFRWQLSRLQFDVDKLTIHGLEPAGEVPYVSVDHLRARIKILSILQPRIALRELSLEGPVVHIIVGEDGRSNHPPFKLPGHGGNAIQKLHDLSLERLDAHAGWLLWNQRRLPLDFSAKDFSLTGEYAAAEDGYQAQARVGALAVSLGSYGPLAARAEANLTLHPEGAAVKSLEIATQRSTLHLDGNLMDWRSPAVRLAYRVDADAPEFASMARLPEMAAGRIEASGSATFNQASFASSGKAIAKAVTWKLGLMALRELSAGLEFTADSERITIPHLFASLPGGSLTGQAEIVNWRPAQAASLRPGDSKNGIGRERGPQRTKFVAVQEHGSAKFMLRSLPLKQIVTTFSRQASLPNLAGNTSGTIDVNWQGALRNAEAKVNLNVSPPPLAWPGDIPVTGLLRGTYFGRQGFLQLAELSAASTATRLQASGTLGGRGGNLRFTISTSKVEELQPALDRLHLRQPLPVEVAGTASLFGAAAGSIAAPQIAARLELHDFVTVLPRITEEPGRHPEAASAEGTSSPARWLAFSDAADTPSASAAAAGRPAPLRLHWDSLHADFVYSPEQLSFQHGKVMRGKTEIEFDGSCALTSGELTESSPVELRVQVRNAELNDVQAITGMEAPTVVASAGVTTHYPVSGQLEGTFQVRGSRRQLNGSGHLRALGVVAYGQPVRSVDADVEFRGAQIRIPKLAAASSFGGVTGNGSYSLASREFTFALHGTNFELERISNLQSRRLRLQGTLAFEARGSGTPEAPEINASLRLRDLFINDEKLGGFRIEAVTHGAEMELTGRSSFQDASLALDGAVHLRGDMPMELKLVAGNFALDPALRGFFFAGHAARATVDAELLLEGPLRTSAAMSGELSVTKLTGSLEGLPLRNAGPLRLHLQAGVLKVEQFRLEGLQKHYFEIGGEANLAGDQRLNLQADAKTDLKLLQTLAPDLSSRGLAELSVQVRGTAGRPALRGQVRISDGAVSYVDLPGGLSDINGVLAFNQDRLQVQELVAVMGGGRLQLGGFVSYGKTASAKTPAAAIHTLMFNLTADGKNIRLRYPEGVSSGVDVSLVFSGSTGNAMLSGNVIVNRLALNPQFDFASYLGKGKQIRLEANPNSTANNIRLDVRVSSAPQLQMQSSLARVTGNVNLHIGGSAAKPVVLGRISILEGNLNLTSSTYRLDRGEITFSNPVSIDPNIDIEASTRVRDYDITLGLQGTLSRINVSYRSDPPLPSADIISLLALGRTEEANQLPGASQQSAALNESASTVILSQALNSTVNSRLQKLFGVSRIKIDPNVGGPQTGANARLTMEQTVSNRVTLTYITNLAQSAQQIIRFEYFLTSRFSIVGVRDQNGVVSFDIFIRRRKH
ncbi:MAG: translocation/assembly module TamB domain-containing protein [Candidatus Korobacteraceae bacterium]